MRGADDEIARWLQVAGEANYQHWQHRLADAEALARRTEAFAHMKQAGLTNQRIAELLKRDAIERGIPEADTRGLGIGAESIRRETAQARRRRPNV